ncbi:MAG: AMP-binding protein, partial [Thermodesulfobacteriota bacterium]|nr:AMP-binding protein [Thermodesulfobacteriota bacterium]
MEVKPGSRGKSAPCLTIDIVDDKGGSLPAGEVGHIAAKVKPVHPVGVFRGYIGNGKSNHDAFRGDRYFTGDKAYKDQDGYFWFVGRVDDV